MDVVQGRIHRIEVRRGAPCGATWKAAARIQGMAAAEASARMGLEVQFFCSADPAGWDPIHGKSPVHLAGHLHARAMEKALRENGEESTSGAPSRSHPPH